MAYGVAVDSCMRASNPTINLGPNAVTVEQSTCART